MVKAIQLLPTELLEARHMMKGRRFKGKSHLRIFPCTYESSTHSDMSMFYAPRFPTSLLAVKLKQMCRSKSRLLAKELHWKTCNKVSRDEGNKLGCVLSQCALQSEHRSFRAGNTPAGRKFPLFVRRIQLLPRDIVKGEFLEVHSLPSLDPVS